MKDNVLIKCVKHEERMGNLAVARRILGRLRDAPMDRVWRVLLEGALRADVDAPGAPLQDDGPGVERGFAIGGSDPVPITPPCVVRFVCVWGGKRLMRQGVANQVLLSP